MLQLGMSDFTQIFSRDLNFSPSHNSHRINLPNKFNSKNIICDHTIRLITIRTLGIYYH